MIDDDSTGERPDGQHGDEGERPSKTQRKKEMHALQALGQELVDLSRDQLAGIDLPDELREAIDFAHRVTSHEGRRRHMQYIGKLMRRVDADEVRAAIGRATGESRAAVALMHLAERWRDRLLDDDDALTAFIVERPGADVQWLRDDDPRGATRACGRTGAEARTGPVSLAARPTVTPRFQRTTTHEG